MADDKIVDFNEKKIISMMKRGFCAGYREGYIEVVEKLPDMIFHLMDLHRKETSFIEQPDMYGRIIENIKEFVTTHAFSLKEEVRKEFYTDGVIDETRISVTTYFE